MTLVEEDRIILHDLRGVNVKVDFFLGTRKELLKQASCISYSICWEAVDIRVDLITFREKLSELAFFFNTQQLFIDDQVISGEVISFNSEPGENGILSVSCKILIGRD